MKSIKEKVQTDYPKSDIVEEEMTRICYRVGFEKGSNYVLEEIERIVNSAIENKSMTIPTWRLNYIIKQLKK